MIALDSCQRLSRQSEDQRAHESCFSCLTVCDVKLVVEFISPGEITTVARISKFLALSPYCHSYPLYTHMCVCICVSVCKSHIRLQRQQQQLINTLMATRPISFLFVFAPQLFLNEKDQNLKLRNWSRQNEGYDKVSQV